MLRKAFRWFGIAICQISAPELLALALNVAAFILYGSFVQNFYLWAIVMICDILVLCAHGAWLDAGGHTYGPWRAPTPHIVRLVAFAVLFILASEHRQDSILSTYVWYVVVVSAICHAFYSILLTMHLSDQTWLEGTHGRVGVPNWISITRMALSVLVPHLYAVQPFGKASSLIATCTLVAAIITDAADGYIARHFNQTTKAGKALDPLGDKVIFYPTAIAFLLATKGTVFLPAGPMRVMFYVCLGTMVLRDFAFIVWFFVNYDRLGAVGVSASIVDKIRMGAMCAWLGSSAIALTFADLQSRLAIAGFVSIIIVAALSIVSIIVDYGRIKPLIAEPKAGRHAEHHDSAGK
ncbi:MAG: CDP-alcohol phosphatidyltransferase family protein [Candidatus Saccharibacteria bacterium]|nr:CDP-alcohol phosphatidyltransferase family protein [Candidatus Saccharibacteria bacterium]